eukprot:jgi/Botrbrau1/12647/Bobra.67_1s0013.1
MKLVLFTSPGTVDNEAIVIDNILRRGCETLHLRKPSLRLKEYEEAIQCIDSPLHSRLVLHSHHHLSLKYKVKGLHFPERIRPEPPPSRMANQTISTSFHRMEEVLELKQHSWDYVFLSPIFNSISKKGYTGAFDEMALLEGICKSAVPVIALGGITKDNLSTVAEYGFEGAAVLGSVWEAPDPEAAFVELQTACRRL